MPESLWNRHALAVARGSAHTLPRPDSTSSTSSVSSMRWGTPSICLVTTVSVTARAR